MKLRLPLSLKLLLLTACSNVIFFSQSAAYASDGLSLNFYRSGDDAYQVSGTNMLGLDQVIANNWNNCALTTGSNAVTWNNLHDNFGSALSGVTASVTAIHGWSHPGVTADSSLNQKLLAGAISAGANSSQTVTIANVPYLTYKVYIYFGGDADDANNKFTAMTVNGTSYTADGTNAAKIGTNTWGTRSSGNNDYNLTIGTNVLEINGLTGTTLTLASVAYDCRDSDREYIHRSIQEHIRKYNMVVQYMESNGSGRR